MQDKTRWIQKKWIQDGVMLDMRYSTTGMRTSGMPGPEGCRTGKILDMTGEMQDRKNAGQEGCRTGRMQSSRASGQKGYMCDARKLGFRIDGMLCMGNRTGVTGQEGCRTGVIQDRFNIGQV